MERWYNYDVALSFAGEDRAYVSKFARELKKRKIAVFFDEYEEASLWGRDLYQHLSKIYSETAKYTIVFVSKHYSQKLWSKLELKSAQSKAFKESSESILPVRFDDTALPGMPDTIGYIDLRNTTPKALAMIFLEKINGKGPDFDFKHGVLNEATPSHWSQSLLTVKFNKTCVLFNLAHYTYLNQILDDLYFNYLIGDVKPFTYGAEWILFRGLDRIIVPLQWVADKFKPTHQIDPSWSLETRIEDVGIIEGEMLEVWFSKSSGRELDRVYGLLTNNDDIALILNYYPKGIVFVQENFYQIHDVPTETANLYKHHFVLRDWLSRVNSRFLIENDGPLPLALLDKLIQTLYFH